MCCCCFYVYVVKLLVLLLLLLMLSLFLLLWSLTTTGSSHAPVSAWAEATFSATSCKSTGSLQRGVQVAFI